MNGLQGKVAIISGGAGGIGSATATRLASEGAKVLIADLDFDRAEEVAARIGGDASAVHLNAFEPDSIKAMIDTAIDRYGRLDILNNNVANTGGSGTGADTTVVDTPIETWDATFAVNIRSYFIATKFALPHMIEQGSGAIINIASDSGLGGDSALVAYGSSKAAVINFTRYVTAQYGRAGIRCNAVAPGPIATPGMVARSPQTLESTLKAVYVPEIGGPEQIASVVTFLASEEATYMNGSVVNCDGGLDAVITPWMASGGLRN